MRYFSYNILGLFLLTSCMPTQDRELLAQPPTDHDALATRNILNNPEANTGISILNTGPRGGGYTTSKGMEINYRVFRIRVFNDTIKPIKLDLDFPLEPVALSPDSTVLLDVFLLPDAFTPDSILDEFNFGVQLEEFYESETDALSTLEISIQPNEQHVLYVVVRFKSQVARSKTRAKLFVEGQDTDAPLFPVTSLKTYQISGNPLNLIYGLAVDPPNHYALIPCGEIHIEE